MTTSTTTPSPTKTLTDALREPADIRFSIEADVATITLDCPAAANMLTPSSLARLKQIAETLADDQRTSCVVITGAGTDHFSSGIFSIETRTAYAKDDVLRIVRLANEAFDRIEALPQLVIGALNGAVRAGGGELALACDFRICASHATLAFHETSYACFPGAGAPIRLPAVVGAGRALELIATGRCIDAEEMQRIGFVIASMPAGELTSHVRAMAAGIAAKGPLGISGAKRVARVAMGRSAEAARDLSQALRTSLEYSHDVDEAIAAHRERRPATYLGR